jgi:SAM-dependent methyltransferase
MTTLADTCPLCGSGALSPVSRDERHRRLFRLCRDCALISVPPQYRLSKTDEAARYALHDNTLSNQGYVDFLNEVADVAVGAASEMPRRRLSAGGTSEPPVKLLDFGCGKNAALCRLLERRGMDCRSYDPLYENLRLPEIADKYDIIAACEVVEHLRDLAGELRFMRGLLRDGGAIIIRTRLYDGADVDIGAGASDFKNWWYAQDPTHINFFSRKSLDMVASIFDKRIEETGYMDIFIFK